MQETVHGHAEQETERHMAYGGHVPQETEYEYAAHGHTMQETVHGTEHGYAAQKK